MLSYEEFKEKKIKYPKGTKCFIPDCYEEGLWEMGDSRYYCPGCEEHVGLKDDYKFYLEYIQKFV